jgi:hypothetical protein
MPGRGKLRKLLRNALLALGLCLVLGACKRAYDIGDRVLVDWEGKVYPAVIIEVPAPGKVKVHYDGYDAMWDEVIARNRIRGFVEGQVAIPEPPEKVRRTAVEAAKTNQHKIGDRVMVDWHASYYPTVVVGVVGPERYRVHYEGYGNEWDENVGAERIKAK